MKHFYTNPDILEIAYKKYYPLIKTIAYKILKNEEEAKDVAGNSFLKLCNYRDVQSMTLEVIRVLLMTIAKNEAYDFWRKEESKRKYLGSSEARDEQSFEMVWERESAKAEDYKLKNEITIELIKEIVPQLPDRQREVFSLRFYDRKSAQQVSDLLHISVHTVNNIYSDAKKNLKKMIEARREKK